MANPRYYELKYEGNIYTKDYEIKEILIENNLNWFFDCEIENIRIEILNETLIINSGVFYSGTFEYGVIRDVEWKSGKFINGVIYNGVYKKINLEKGIIFNGKFIDGEILYADIRGGVFVNIDVSKFVKKPTQDTQIQDTQIQDTQIQAQNIQDTQTQARNIQSQVQKTQESRNLYKYNTFIKI